MKTREITKHQVNECNRQIQIIAHEAGSGGAAVRYDIEGPKKHVPGIGPVPSFGENLKFQDGPIADGVNGITHEVLLAIIEDRLVGFQSGPFACERNVRALRHLRACQDELKNRTDERVERGVEGTHTV